MEVPMKGFRLLGFALFLSSGVAFTNAVLADDNCADVENGLRKEWAVVVVGDCRHPSPEPSLLDWLGAIADGLAQCRKVAEAGGLGLNWLSGNCRVGACWGSRPVANWLGGPAQGKPTTPLPDTYVGYCASDKAPTPLAPAAISEQEKKVDNVLARLRK
jgi:hypothetical protein